MDPLSFVVVYQPARGGLAQSIGQRVDANTATIVAHHLLDRLRRQGRDGEVRIVRADPDQTVVLRLPLVSHSSRMRPRPHPRSPLSHARPAHPGGTSLVR